MGLKKGMQPFKVFWNGSLMKSFRLAKSDDLREYIVDDYLLLYLLRGNQLVFLSIKHHRQLSFDLKRFWQES